MAPVDDERTIVSSVKVASAQQAGQHACLHLVEGPGAPRSFILSQPSMAIGRDPSADIAVETPELSRRHARVNRVGDQYLAVDTDSANGLYVNGIKVHSAALHDGDQLQLANLVFIFRGH